MTSTNLSPITLSISSSFHTFNSQSHFLTQISKTPLKSILISCKSKLIQHPTAMAASSISGDCQLPISTHQFKPFQLGDAADFFMISSPLGFISICGFGSLLSEKSARSTFPELSGFRVARLKGFRRVFAHVAPIFFERGIAKPETKEISSLSVEPCEGEELIVSVFEIQKTEVRSFMEREIEFRYVAVLPETLDGKPFKNPAVCLNL